VAAGAVAYLRLVASAQLVDDVPGRALAVYAHPDDVEVACGGTLARWARAGCETHLVVVCQGDKGSVDPATDPVELAATRALEVAAAADLLGLTSHRLLGLPDGEVEVTPELLGQLVAIVRALRAEVVIAPDPTAMLFGRRYVNHRDHRVVGTAAMDAVAPAAAMPHYFPSRGPAWAVRELWLSGTLEPDVHVDVEPVLDVKAAALACHRTQVDMPGELLHSVVQQRAQDAGRTAGIRYAESFRRMLLA
jgi:LmbE family N-acetylglucosaminyl deacetylase